MANTVYLIFCLFFAVTLQVQCQETQAPTPAATQAPTEAPPQTSSQTPPQNQPVESDPKLPPPAYIASSHNKPVQVQPISSSNPYNFFDNMVLGLGWIIPVITVVLLGLCLLSICGLLERNLTKKPEARLYYQSPGGAAAAKSTSYGSPDDSIAQQKYALAQQDMQYGYNDPAPEYPEAGYGYGAAAGSPEQEGYGDTSGQHLYRPDQV